MTATTTTSSTTIPPLPIIMDDMKSEQALQVGDSYYVDEQYELALDYYTIALTVLRSYEINTIIHFRIYSHRSITFYQLVRYQEAYDDALAASAMLSSSSTGGGGQEERESTTSTHNTAAAVAVAAVTPVNADTTTTKNDHQTHTPSSTTTTTTTTPFGGLRSGESELIAFREGIAAFGLGQYKQAQIALERAAQLATLNQYHQQQQQQDGAVGDKEEEEKKMSKKTNNKYEKWIQRCLAKLEPVQPPPPPPPVPSITPKGAAQGSNNATTSTTTFSSAVKTIPTTTTSTTSSSGITPTPSSTSTSMTRGSIGTSTTSTTTGSNMMPPKYQYYQSDKIMTIALLESNVQVSDLQVSWEEQKLIVLLKKNGQEYTMISGQLYDTIDIHQSRMNIRTDKVLIKLYKQKPYEWHDLLSKTEKLVPSSKKPKTTTTSNTNTVTNRDTTPFITEIDDTTAATTPTTSMDTDTTATVDNTTPTIASLEVQPPVAAAAATTTTTDAPEPKKSSTIPRPYASPRDWNSIEKELLEEEEKEEKSNMSANGGSGSGDDAMNKLFQSIYANANEDTRRAMIKSYQTSGGTVLSTNWDEVSQKDYEKERTAPKGMEWKNWEGDKLPMVKDD